MLGLGMGLEKADPSSISTIKENSMMLADDLLTRKTYIAYTNPEESIEKTHLPEPVGEEKCFYIKLRKESPYQYIHVLGITFSKETMVPMRKSSDIPRPCSPVIRLTDNQAEAILKKASVKKVDYWEGTKKRTDFAISFIELKELPAGEYGDVITESE